RFGSTRVFRENQGHHGQKRRDSALHWQNSNAEALSARLQRVRSWTLKVFRVTVELFKLKTFTMANFAINGFGRIGRNVLRAMSQKQVERVRAVNDLTDTHTLAHLLKWDSVHGKFDGDIGYDDENIIVRSHKIKVLKDRDPANLPWKKLDIDVVLESTGLFTSRDKAELHLKAGAKRVLISAPAKDPDVTICIGVND